MPYAAVNDIRMYYEEAEGPPLVLLHGAFGSIDDRSSGWAGLIGLFAPATAPSRSSTAATTAPTTPPAGWTSP